MLLEEALVTWFHWV